MDLKTLALYFGCDALYHMADEPEPYRTKIDWQTLRNVEENPEETFVQLFLRPLSNMTEEEALAIAMKQSDIYLNVKVYDWDGFYIPFEFEYKSSRRRRRGLVKLHSFNPNQFQYLLSKSFDLFGLIEKGEAIEQLIKS